MNGILSVGWPIVIIIGLIGLVLTSVGLKFFKTIKNDEKDSFGARPSERLGFLVLNGIVLLFAALILTFLKLTMPVQ
jgi:hypothetical protein